MSGFTLLCSVCGFHRFDVMEVHSHGKPWQIVLMCEECNAAAVEKDLFESIETMRRGEPLYQGVDKK